MADSIPAPFDVKLMNIVANLAFAAVALMLLAAGAWWVLRQPFFPIVRGHCSGTALVATRVSRHQPSRAIFLRRESSSKSPELKARQSRYAPWKPACDERQAR